MRLLVLAVLVIGSFFSEANADHIRIAMTEWAPYTGKDITKNGLLTALSKEALSRAGYKDVEVLVYPWARAYKEAEEGKVEALLGAGFTDERAKIFAYPESLWTTNDVIAKSAGKFNGMSYTSFDALAPASIGVLNNSESPSYKLFENVKGISVQKVVNVDQLYEMLSLGRIDMFIEDKGSLEYSLANDHREFKSKINFLTPGIASEKNYLVFSKKWPGHHKATGAFTKAVKAMRKDGTFAKISKEFGMTEN